MINYENELINKIVESCGENLIDNPALGDIARYCLEFFDMKNKSDAEFSKLKINLIGKRKVKISLENGNMLTDVYREKRRDFVINQDAIDSKLYVQTSVRCVERFDIEEYTSFYMYRQFNSDGIEEVQVCKIYFNLDDYFNDKPIHKVMFIRNGIKEIFYTFHHDLFMYDHGMMTRSRYDKMVELSDQVGIVDNTCSPDSNSYYQLLLPNKLPRNAYGDADIISSVSDLELENCLRNLPLKQREGLLKLSNNDFSVGVFSDDSIDEALDKYDPHGRRKYL